MNTDRARRILRESEKHSTSAISTAISTLIHAGQAAASPNVAAAESPVARNGAQLVGVVIGVVLPCILSWVSAKLPDATLSDVDRLWQFGFLFSGAAVSSIVLLSIIGVALRRYQRHLIRPLLVACVAIPLIAGSTIVVARVHTSLIAKKKALIELVRGVHWIAYDPRGFDPFLNEYPTPNSIREDLTILKEQAGFTGIITFGNNDTLGQIPYIAHDLDLRVIMGLWVPSAADQKPEDEFSKARKAAEAGVVDAFCVGHVRGESTDHAVVAEWMAELRRDTGLPVTHTAPVVNYIGERGKTLRAIGDWYFPDVGGAWRVHTSPTEALRRTREDCDLAAELPSDKPVLLKMLGFPSGPASSGFSPESQREFFLRFMRDMSFPQHVYPSFAFGFDRPYVGRRARDREEDRDPAGEYLGFFSSASEPIAKPIVADLRRHWGIPSPPPRVPSGRYEIDVSLDKVTQIREHRLYVTADAHRVHFGTILQTPQGGVILRPHSDQANPDGRGASLALAPFVSGHGADSIGARTASVEPSESDIRAHFSGQLSGTTNGRWDIEARIGYDSDLQRVIGQATLHIVLDESLPSLTGDLTVVRLHSSLRSGVPLDDGSTGDTGDTSRVQWSYTAGDGRMHEQSFRPTAEVPATYPQDRSRILEVDLKGNLSIAAEDGPTRNKTPNVRFQIQSLCNAQLNFGAQWDAQADRHAHENFAVTPIVVRQGAPKDKTLSFKYWVEARR